MSSDAEIREATQNIVGQYLALFSAQKWDEWIQLWATDGVLEFPYAPAGRRREYEGHEEILAYMTRLGGRIKTDKLDYYEVHPMVDPTVYFFEMGFSGHLVDTGEPYNQKYISLVYTKDNKITRYREYWNPLASIDANGGRDAWTNNFGLPETGAAQ